MEYVRSALYFIAVLSVLIIVHEWGHFIVAKLCKMRVEDFSLFFGKRLIRLGERNGTEYNIRTIPLGGFVKISGMEPDDISNGAPIFPALSRAKRAEVSVDPDKMLQGLDEEALNAVNFDNVSPRIYTVAEEAVGNDGRLTDNGREELQSLLASTAINADEHRYLEALLSAQAALPDPSGYNQKPIWQRALTIFAGPFMSIFFGYVLFCVMGFTTGLPDLSRIAIGTLIEGKPAYRAGLRPGDQIVAINGVKVSDWDSMVKPIHDNPGHPIRMTIQRNGASRDYTVTPEAEPIEVVENGKKVKKAEGRLGFSPGMAWKLYSPAAAVKQGTLIVYYEVTGTLRSVFSRHASENVGGIIAISGQIHRDSQEGPKNVLFTAALLSVSVGLINLFPIPILDGGHLLLLLVEGIRRRKLSSREVYAAQMVGLSIIGVLFVLVMYNDIHHLFMK